MRRSRTPAGLAAAIVLSLATAGPPRGQDPPPNTLTAAEAKGGWQLLFDGTTTTGWRAFAGGAFPKDRWTIEDGCLKAVGRAGGEGGRHADIVTADRYTDFDLRLEWRIAKNGNSGVKYLLLDTRPVGHEYQMLDDLTNAEAKLGRHRQTGAFYDVLPRSLEAVSRPAGEWNSSRILVSGNHVEHWLNGERVLEYELGSPQLAAAVANSKFRDVAGFGSRRASPILLQDHGSEVWFRSLRLKAATGGK